MQDLGGGCFSPGADCCFLGAEEIRFGLEPVVEGAAVFPAARFVELVGA